MKNKKSKYLIFTIIVLLVVAAAVIGIKEFAEKPPKLNICTFSNGTGYASDYPDDTVRTEDRLYNYEYKNGIHTEEIYSRKAVYGSYHISPDGTQFYYTSNQSDTFGIWRLNIEKQTEEKVFDKPVNDIFFVGDTLYATGLSFKAENEIPIYYSADGDNWELLSTIGEEKADDLLVSDMAEYDGKLYAATAYALYSSEDNGKTWKTFFNQREVVSNLMCMNGKMYFTSHEKGGFRVNDKGQSFNMLDFEIDGKSSREFWPMGSLVEAGDSLWAGTATEDMSANSYAFVWNCKSERLQGYIKIRDSESLIGVIGEQIYLYSSLSGDIRVVEYEPLAY